MCEVDQKATHCRKV